MRRPEEMTEVNLPELIRALGDRIPWRLLVIGGRGLARRCSRRTGEARAGTSISRRSTGCRLDYSDPAFGHDVGFYVFTLPLLEDCRDLLLLILFLAAGADGIAVYWARGALDFRESPPRISPGAAGASLGAARALLRAARDELLAGAL